ncbi:MAG: type II toxin-antitoxin system YhaV family toxin [Betaproteobacteria bacterium]
MSPSPTQGLVVNGWSLYAHPLFAAHVGALITQVEALRQRDPSGYSQRDATKRLAAMAHLAFERIPQDPTRAEYRQGATLGGGHQHWFRAKFFQQYRLFFRYHSGARVIVYAWVNDEDSRRAYERSDDAYRVFRRMLASGHPPNDWDQLLDEARQEGLRLQQWARRLE